MQRIEELTAEKAQLTRANDDSNKEAKTQRDSKAVTSTTPSMLLVYALTFTLLYIDSYFLTPRPSLSNTVTVPL
jgi:hypothetical protein